MTPTIILKDNKPYLIVGSPGGSTIITVVLQVVLNCIDFNMNIREAIERPRFHHQWIPDSIYYEQNAISADVRAELTSMGYNFIDEDPETSVLGIAEGILIDSKQNIIYGADDPRGGGLAAGY